jgi:hypothetical protein
MILPSKLNDPLFREPTSPYTVAVELYFYKLYVTPLWGLSLKARYRKLKSEIKESVHQDEQENNVQYTNIKKHRSI